jgi:hypothetical protein
VEVVPGILDLQPEQPVGPVQSDGDLPAGWAAMTQSIGDKFRQQESGGLAAVSRQSNVRMKNFASTADATGMTGQPERNVLLSTRTRLAELVALVELVNLVGLVVLFTVVVHGNDLPYYDGLYFPCR